MMLQIYSQFLMGKTENYNICGVCDGFRTFVFTIFVSITYFMVSFSFKVRLVFDGKNQNDKIFEISDEISDKILQSWINVVILIFNTCFKV